MSFTRRAARHVEEAGRWWRENRAKAPEALREELDQARQLIASQPEVGAMARNVKLAGVRRILLNRVSYHLYYRLRETPARSGSCSSRRTRTRGHRFMSGLERRYRLFTRDRREGIKKLVKAVVSGEIIDQIAERDSRADEDWRPTRMSGSL